MNLMKYLRRVDGPVFLVFRGPPVADPWSRRTSRRTYKTTWAHTVTSVSKQAVSRDRTLLTTISVRLNNDLRETTTGADEAFSE